MGQRWRRCGYDVVIMLLSSRPKSSSTWGEYKQFPGPPGDNDKLNDLDARVTRSIATVWRSTFILFTTKVRVYNSLVLSLLLYNSETWITRNDLDLNCGRLNWVYHTAKLWSHVDILEKMWIYGVSCVFITLYGHC